MIHYTNSIDTSNSSYEGYSIESLSSDITYYFFVTSLVNETETYMSNIVTTKSVSPVTTNGALLIITMQNNLVKEYDLGISEVNSFTGWFEKRTDGNGEAYYSFDLNYNMGPFLTRKDYIIYDKIICFEIKEYKKY